MCMFAIAGDDAFVLHHTDHVENLVVSIRLLSCYHELGHKSHRPFWLHRMQLHRPFGSAGFTR